MVERFNAALGFEQKKKEAHLQYAAELIKKKKIKKLKTLKLR